MNNKTLEALQASIEKWEQNAEVENLSQALMGAGNCPLCVLFNNHDRAYNSFCKGCPVFESTGYKYCEGTPYMAAQDADESYDVSAFRAAARKEVKFLKSLLPEASS
jgi:hypothetical protein